VKPLFRHFPVHDLLVQVSDVTSEVENASAMNAVPIVSSTPRIRPSSRFIAESSRLRLENASVKPRVPFFRCAGMAASYRALCAR
jgi:hypothetical protein